MSTMMLFNAVKYYVITKDKSTFQKHSKTLQNTTPIRSDPYSLNPFQSPFPAVFIATVVKRGLFP